MNAILGAYGLPASDMGTPVFLADAAAALIGLLAVLELRRHDTELKTALWLWAVALTTAIGAA